ncbi:transmembrane protein 180 isoform X1 [Aythya fuligula]|uniref:Transmembrane protein 180 isoform X1 n=1 Tax=Aythya fuligula TaxID=219594 RepID=A0A6J3DE95_AYTFU|nr:transmembrane protein 180 isoform X1 [Aythya fuligula]XP_032047677.1 transmembrane protein 180 isoform X1 [Aythya fuligula]
MGLRLLACLFRLPTAVIYGSLSLFVSILHNVFLLYYVDTFVSVYKIDKLSFWIGETVFLIWNSLNDPLFGWLSDRVFLSTQQPGAEISSPEVVLKRLRALSHNGPLFAISFLAFWVAWAHPGVQFLLCLCMYDSFLTMVDLHHNALLADLAVSARDRTSLNFYCSLFSAIGSLSVFMSYTVWNKEDFFSFRIFCVALALCSIVGFTLSTQLLRQRFEADGKAKWDQESTLKHFQNHLCLRSHWLLRPSENRTKLSRESPGPNWRQSPDLPSVWNETRAVHRETFRPPGEEDHPGRISPAAQAASQLPLVCLHEPGPAPAVRPDLCLYRILPPRCFLHRPPPQQPLLPLPLPPLWGLRCGPRTLLPEAGSQRRHAAGRTQPGLSALHLHSQQPRVHGRDLQAAQPGGHRPGGRGPGPEPQEAGGLGAAFWDGRAGHQARANVCPPHWHLAALRLHRLRHFPAQPLGQRGERPAEAGVCRRLGADPPPGLLLPPGLRAHRLRAAAAPHLVAVQPAREAPADGEGSAPRPDAGGSARSENDLGVPGALLVPGWGKTRGLLSEETLHL